MATVTIERMAVEVEGQGDPVLMVHGLGGTSNTFTPQVLALAGRFRVVRPDLPGSGRSPTPDAALSIGLFVDSLVRICGVLGIERAHVVGHSLGAVVAQHLAVERPSLVRTLTLFGALTEPPDAARGGLRERAAKARADGMQPVADAVAQASLSADTRHNQPAVVAFVRESLMRQCPEGYARTCEALAAARAAEAARIRARTLLLAGDDDPVAPPSVARLLGERIDGAQVRLLPRCGHWITLERAADATAALGEWLR
ncbi:alpha/beta fold hydrolase [Azospirillum sp. ST 5-10]|uniref:alpha/beta fold hydrolase n=1 Tax=unclassified Azospirillum TaxID=2630922 RepID=UPI003F4A4F84